MSQYRASQKMPSTSPMTDVSGAPSKAATPNMTLQPGLGFSPNANAQPMPGFNLDVEDAGNVKGKNT